MDYKGEFIQARGSVLRLARKHGLASKLGVFWDSYTGTAHPPNRALSNEVSDPPTPTCLTQASTPAPSTRLAPAGLVLVVMPWPLPVPRDVLTTAVPHFFSLNRAARITPTYPRPFSHARCLEPGKVVTRLPGPAEHSQHCLQSGGGGGGGECSQKHPPTPSMLAYDWLIGPLIDTFQSTRHLWGVTLRPTLIVTRRTIPRTQIRINFNTLGLFLKHLDYLYICFLDTTPGTRSVWSLHYTVELACLPRL